PLVDLLSFPTRRSSDLVLNDLRKEHGLAVTDRVRIRVAGGPRVDAALGAHGEWIAGEVLAVALDRGAGGDHRLDIDGESVAVALDRKSTRLNSSHGSIS